MAEGTPKQGAGYAHTVSGQRHYKAQIEYITKRLNAPPCEVLDGLVSPVVLYLNPVKSSSTILKSNMSCE